MAPALAAVGTYALLVAWNEYLYQFLLLSSRSNKTVAITIAEFFENDDSPWNYLMAAAVVYCLPPIVIDAAQGSGAVPPGDPTPGSTMNQLELRPGLADVPVAESAISFIDGKRARLEYRGIAVETLARESSYEETAWLLLKGDLPTQRELADFDDQLRHRRPQVVRIAADRTKVDAQAAAFDPPQCGKRLFKCVNARPVCRIVLRIHQNPKLPRASILLRVPRPRPKKRQGRPRAEKQRDELAAPHHSITSLAAERKSGEIATPSARAARTLTTKSNLSGSSIGKSPGLAPRRMRST